MKQVYTLAVCLLILFSCKKSDLREANVYPNNYMQQVTLEVQDSLTTEDFLNLDFSRAVLNSVDSVELYLLRLPFKNKTDDEFVLLRTDKMGRIRTGRIVKLEGRISQGGVDRSFNGRIVLQSLMRKLILESPIQNGFISAFHSNMLMRTALVQPDSRLPEVIITYVLPAEGGISWSAWISLQSLLGSSGLSYFSFYSGNDGGGSNWSWSGGGGMGGGGGSPLMEPTIQVDFESVLDKPEIDLQKFVACFNTIPDAGATCSIELLADIPVDSDPNKIFNFQSQSPGHTILQLKKMNGTQSVVQNIGFYPKSDWKSILTNAPIDGKFVDNGEHEFNVSFFMSLTPAQLKAVLTEILYLKEVKYDIDNFNCTDWALDVFNKVRTDKLTIPLYDIPGNVPSLGTRTPNGVYNKLREMKTSGHPEVANINYNFSKGFVARSSGPCN